MLHRNTINLYYIDSGQICVSESIKINVHIIFYIKKYEISEHITVVLIK